MAASNALSEAEINRLHVMVAAGSDMAGAEETDEDCELGPKVLTGELTADEAISIRLAQIDKKYGITR